MSKIKDENFYQVSGWMLNRLELKGIALAVYAIIYGFTQDGESRFTGSIKYLCDFTGASKPTVMKALNDLTEKGYIQKYEIERNGVRFCEYQVSLQVVKNLYRPGQEILPGGGKETLPGGGKESLPNNKISDNEKLKENIYTIISHLNEKAGTHYRSETPSTVRLLKGLLTGNQPFTVQDCITVIDKKCAEWRGSEMEKYLRPETLFGGKFESYLNARTSMRPQQPQQPKRVADENESINHTKSFIESLDIYE